MREYGLYRAVPSQGGGQITWLPPMKTGLRYSPFLYCNPCFAAQHVFGFCVYFQRDSARLAAAESMVQVDSGVFDEANPEVTHSP